MELIPTSRLEIENAFAGGDIVSTGLDSRDGNTVGDDRKSSKTRKRKRRTVRIGSLNTA